MLWQALTAGVGPRRWRKENQGVERTRYAFKEQHTQACVLAAKHSLIHSLVEDPQACELGQVLIYTTGLGTAQQHRHLPSVCAVLGPGVDVVETEKSSQPGQNGVDVY